MPEQVPWAVACPVVGVGRSDSGGVNSTTPRHRHEPSKASASADTAGAGMAQVATMIRPTIDERNISVPSAGTPPRRRGTYGVRYTVMNTKKEGRVPKRGRPPKLTREVVAAGA